MLDNSLCCPVFLLQAELLEPAVKGTLNVLSSCAKFTSVRRVILTSSAAAVVFTGKPITPDVVIDETWSSDPNICKELKVWMTLFMWYFENCNDGSFEVN